MPLRFAKILLPLALAAFALLVTVDNLIDYNTNFLFVRHVMTMDTVFPGNTLTWRAINWPPIWHASYWLIIAAEAVTGALLFGGACALWRARRASAATFNAAKTFVTLGCTVGFLLWFFGFMVVGGEWFCMWQSQLWNGQGNAFKIYMTLLGVLIFVLQPDQDLA